jgi:hypothetical protein
MNLKEEAEEFIRKREAALSIDEIKNMLENIKKELDKLEKIIYIKS